MTKGILKAAAGTNGGESPKSVTSSVSGLSSRKSRKLQWDEVALKEAQQELSALDRSCPVDEPKTPFIHGIRSPSKSPSESPPTARKPLSDDDEGDGEGSAKKYGSNWSTTSSEGEDLSASAGELSDFEQHRRVHYKMKEARKLGRHLVETDESGAEESDISEENK